MARTWRGVIEEYRDRLPVGPATPVVQLDEGGTPLVRSEALSAETGCEVFLKFEGANPTGSFKDRGMTVTIPRSRSHPHSGRSRAAMVRRRRPTASADSGERPTP